MAKIKKETFGEQYARLEIVAQYFESGDIDLDEALVKFEEGIALVKEMKTYLKNVESKVIDLKKEIE